MKTPAFFKFSASTTARLEDAQAFSESRGRKMTKTELVERAIQMLATSEGDIHGGQLHRKEPLPMLMQAFSDWKAGSVLSREQYLHLSQYAHAIYKRHHGLFNKTYLIDLLMAARSIIALRTTSALAHNVDALDRYYTGCLYERRAQIMDSFTATIECIKGVDFVGSPELPARTLMTALRDEPPIDEQKLHEALAPFRESLFRLAIRNYLLDTGKTFDLPTQQQEQSTISYWGDSYYAKDLAEGNIQLEVSASLTTFGLILKDLSTSSVMLKCSSFIDVGDFLCLANNLSDGGFGGNRGCMLFEKATGAEEGFCADLSVICDGKSLGYMLTDNSLKALFSCVSSLISDEKFISRYALLAQLYGDV